MKNGVYIVDKRWGESSFNVVRNARIKFNTRRVGHTGTLDPLASGILPILVGDATKLSDYLMNHDKEYVAELSLGQRTSTGDSEGKVIEEKPFDFKMSAEKIQKTLNSFIGTTEQIPPMYSAIKVGGRKLYELAREGKEIERKPRPVTIYAIDIKDIDLENGSFTMDVTCSKGTYIRTLCHDIGEKLGVGAAMDQLLRTKVSIFEVDQALTLAQIEERIQQEDRSFVLPVDQLFTQYPKMQVADEEAAKMLRNGNPITIGKLKSFNEAKKDQNKSRVLVYNENGEFRAIYELRGNYYRVVKMF